MGVHVVAVYRPKAGQEETLVHEAFLHVPLLRELGLATAHPTTLLRASDGTVVEHFEWVSHEAIQAAHEHPDVLAMWGRYGQCCEFGALTDLPNASTMFAEFEFLGTT